MICLRFMGVMKSALNKAALPVRSIIYRHLKSLTFVLGDKRSERNGTTNLEKKEERVFSAPFSQLSFRVVTAPPEEYAHCVFLRFEGNT